LNLPSHGSFDAIHSNNAPKPKTSVFPAAIANSSTLGFFHVSAKDRSSPRVLKSPS
jgi:hypothetical protein